MFVDIPVIPGVRSGEVENGAKLQVEVVMELNSADKLCQHYTSIGRYGRVHYWVDRNRSIYF